MEPLRRHQRTLREERFHRELAEEGVRTRRREAAGYVTVGVGGGSKAEHPVAQVFRVGGILIRPMRADEEAIPVPHLVVVAGRNQVRILDEPFGRLDRLRRQATEVRAERREQIRIGARLRRTGKGDARTDREPEGATKTEEEHGA
jgi:hypothetical protein